LDLGIIEFIHQEKYPGVEFFSGATTLFDFGILLKQIHDPEVQQI
jgi:hypothetical protein